MILGAQIALLILGIYALATGKFPMGKGRKSLGPMARIAGAILFVPLIGALVIGFGLGMLGLLDEIGRWGLVGIQVALILVAVIAAQLIAKRGIPA